MKLSLCFVFNSIPMCLPLFCKAPVNCKSQICMPTRKIKYWSYKQVPQMTFTFQTYKFNNILQLPILAYFCLSNRLFWKKWSPKWVKNVSKNNSSCLLVKPQNHCFVRKYICVHPNWKKQFLRIAKYWSYAKKLTCCQNFLHPNSKYLSFQMWFCWTKTKYQVFQQFAQKIMIFFFSTAISDFLQKIALGWDIYTIGMPHSHREIFVLSKKVEWCSFFQHILAAFFLQEI